LPFHVRFRILDATRQDRGLPDECLISQNTGDVPEPPMSLHATVEDMAKKSPDKPKTVAKPEPNRKPMVVQMRGSEEWKAFIERLADMDGDTVAKFIERLIRKEAKERGITDLPKR
jgi:hypothetical protein